MISPRLDVEEKVLEKGKKKFRFDGGLRTGRR